MPLVSRWGSKVTSVPAREPKANSPKPITLTARPIPVDLESKAESLGSLVGRPIPGFKELSTVIPPAPPAPPSPSKPSAGPTDLYGDVIAPANGPTDLSALEDLNNSLYSVKIGAGSRIDLGDPGVFQFENELNREVITISAWIKMTGSPMNDDSYDFTVFEYRDDAQRGFTARIRGGRTYANSSQVDDPKISFTAFSETPDGVDEYHVSAISKGVDNVPAQNEWSYVMFSFDRTSPNPEEGIKIWLNGVELPIWSRNAWGTFSDIYRSSTSQLNVGGSPLSPSHNSASCDVYVDDIVFRRSYQHPLNYEFEGLAGPESESWLLNYMPEALYTCGDYEDGLGSRIRTEDNYLPSGSDVSQLDGQFVGNVEFVEPGAPGTTKLSALEDLNNSLYSVKIGAGSRIDLGDPGVFQFENELNREVITISAWIKMTGSPMNDDSYDFTVFDYRDDVQRGFGARVLGGQTTSFTVIPPKILFYAFSESDPGAGANYDEGGVSATAEGIENVPAQNEWSYVMFSFDRTASNPEDGIKIWLDGRELPVSRATHGSGFTGLYRKPNSQLSVGAQPQSPSNNNPGAVYVDDIVMRRIHSHPLVEEVEGLAGPESESWLGDYSPEALYTCGDYEDGLGSRIRTINHYLPSGSDVSHLEGQFIGDVQFVEPGAPGTRKKPSWW